MSRVFSNRHVRDGFIVLMLCAITVFLIHAPSEAMDAAKQGLELCANVIVPSLFPFFVLSGLVVNLGMVRYLSRLFTPLMQPLFGLSGNCSIAVALGMIGGYPVGARTALNLYQSHQISKQEAERLLVFCNNCGPAFIFGVVGAGIFSSGSIGLLLYLMHILASVLIGVGARLVFGTVRQSAFSNHVQSVQPQRFPSAFTHAISDGCSTTLQICAFVLCFTVLIRFLFYSGLLSSVGTILSSLFQPLGVPSTAIESLLIGLIELSSGVWALKGANVGLSSQVCMAAFILGWAGLCVHCQVLSFTGDSGLSFRPYLLGKLLHAVVSSGLVWAAYAFLPLPQSASSFYTEQIAAFSTMDFSYALSSSTQTAAIVWGIVCLICLYYMKKSSGNRQIHRV